MITILICAIMFLIIPSGFLYLGVMMQSWFIILFMIPFFIVDIVCWCLLVREIRQKRRIRTLGKETYMKIIDYADGTTYINGVPNVILVGLCYVDKFVREIRISTSSFDTSNFPVGSWASIKYLEGKAILVSQVGFPESTVNPIVVTEVNKVLGGEINHD